MITKRKLIKYTVPPKISLFAGIVLYYIILYQQETVIKILIIGSSETLCEKFILL